MVRTGGRVEKGEDCIGEALVAVEVHKRNVVVLAAWEDEIEYVVVGCAKGPAPSSRLVVRVILTRVKLGGYYHPVVDRQWVEATVKLAAASSIYLQPADADSGTERRPFIDDVGQARVLNKSGHERFVRHEESGLEQWRHGSLFIFQVDDLLVIISGGNFKRIRRRRVEVNARPPRWAAVLVSVFGVTVMGAEEATVSQIARFQDMLIFTKRKGNKRKRNESKELLSPYVVSLPQSDRPSRLRASGWRRAVSPERNVT